MINWYNKEGKVIDVSEANKLLGDRSYAVVKKTDIGDYRLSTVWLGLDHSWDFNPHEPVIFETMIFHEPTQIKFRQTKEIPEDYPQLHMWCDRYCTEQQALEGHEEACNIVRNEIKQTKEDV